MSSTPSPSSSRSRRVALEVALALGAFSIATAEFATMSLLPQFTSSLGASIPEGGQAISAYALGVVVGAPVLAMLGATMPKRAFLAALMGVYAIANAASAAVPSYMAFVALRFVSGVPHGAYFGVACLLAASLAPPDQRARATARVMLGFTVGTILGVPLANTLGLAVGWRWAFVVVGGLATVTACAVWLLARDAAPTRAVSGGSWRRELGALGRRQVWLTLAIGAIGQGGMFSIFSYLAAALEKGAHASPAALPAALMLFGTGMSVGVLVNGWLADRLGALKAIGLCLTWSVGAMAVYAISVGHVAGMLAGVTLVGVGGGLATNVQTRLMDVAGDAQTMAAALNHAAFNVANAIGPTLGGWALAAGFGWSSTGWVGVGLAVGGLAVSWLARVDARRAAPHGAC